MGIHGLFQLLKSNAPDSYKETDKSVYKGKVIAIDSSILLYQFLVQIRTKGTGYGQQLLVDDNGEVTSHIQGFFNRAANLLENGIKPVFVFDGKPPVLKYAELAKRKESKKKAEKEAEDAAERAENAEDSDLEEAIDDLNKASKRNIHITKQQTEDVKILLRLMGVPVIDAPCEAEAQCAELVKGGKVYAAGTEDMDALTFGTPVILRKLTMPESAKEKVIEIKVAKVLTGLELSYHQFIDFCILCGCDYCESIKGIGPKTALKMLHKHGDIETILENLPDKYTVPASLENNLEEVRKLFTNPDVKAAKEIEIVFGKPDREGIIDFLVGQKGFNKERVTKVIDKITGRVKVKVDEKQPTIDSFFKKKEVVKKESL
jgi:flap endonuclease-1